MYRLTAAAGLSRLFLSCTYTDTIRFTRLSISQQWGHQQMFIFDWIITVKLVFALFLDHCQVRVQINFFRFWRCWIFILCCWLDMTGTSSLQTFHSNWFVNITLHCLRHPSDVWGNVNIFSNGCVFSSVAYQLFSLLPRHSKAFHTCLSVSFFIWEKNCFIGSSVLL